jgi:hypothetical protein
MRWNDFYRAPIFWLYLSGGRDYLNNCLFPISASYCAFIVPVDFKCIVQIERAHECVVVVQVSWIGYAVGYVFVVIQSGKTNDGRLVNLNVISQTTCKLVQSLYVCLFWTHQTHFFSCWTSFALIRHFSMNSYFTFARSSHAKFKFQLILRHWHCDCTCHSVTLCCLKCAQL